MTKAFLPFSVLLVLATAIALMIPWMTLAVADETPPLEQLTAKMQETYDTTHDLSAKFVQELTLASVKKTEREEGTVYFKNPGRMYWEYTRPKSKKLVVNPQKAWLYVPEDHVVYAYDAKAMYRSKLIIRFLSGIGKLQEDFKVGYASPGATDSEGHFLLILIPKQSDLGTDQLHLTVDRKSFQIVQCRFSDAYGNLTRIRFQNVRINQQLPESLFHFKPPRGVEIFNVAP
ncbi:MAG: outer membrane lipoprotein carrier protein LolA [Pseudomonadota bacterium]